MDALSTLDPVPEDVLVRTRTGSQRDYLPRLESTARALLHFARLADDPTRRRRLDAHLQPLRRSLMGAPYWRETLGGKGLSPSDLRSLDGLLHFPALDRATCARHWAQLPSLEDASEIPGDLALVASSGSTGEPVRVVKDRFDQIHMWAVLRFWVRWTAVRLPPRPRIVLLCGLPRGLAYSVRMPAFFDGALHRISLQRPRPLDRLRRAQPSILFSDPEGLHWLAAQPDPPRPALILTSASHFSAAQREAVTRALGAPIVNYYGVTETGPIAWECLETAGRFHVLLPDVFVEESNGELLVTRLRSSVLPLLRYRTGDPGRVVEDHCGCGYHGLTIEGFVGRGVCLFERPDGVKVDAWRLVSALKYTRLRSFRLTQEGPRDFLMEIGGPHPETAGDVLDLLGRLERALVALGWNAPSVRWAPLVGGPEGVKPSPFRSRWPQDPMRPSPAPAV